MEIKKINADYPEIKLFVEKWLDKKGYTKSELYCEGYWYTSKDGSNSINLAPMLATFFLDMQELYKIEKQ